MTGTPDLLVLCALPSEAAPLVARWDLRQVRDDPFPVFRGGQRTLVVSGVGAHASAAAVGYAAALHERHGQRVWCNAGIAGHDSLDVGTAIAACTVAHARGTPLWHPFVSSVAPCLALPCVTYDEAVTDYPDGACCDMEAAGFLAALARVGTTDLAMVVKVVSDNRTHGLDGIVRTRVDELIASRHAAIEAMIEAGCAATLHRPMIARRLAPLLERARYTRAQQRQLHELAMRLHGHAPDAWHGALPADDRDPASVLAALRDALPSPGMRDGTIAVPPA